MRLFKMFRIFLCSILLLTGFSCQDRQPSQPLRIGIDRFAGFAPVYLARDRDIYKGLGLEVEPQMIIGTVERTSELASGRIDALCTTVDSLILSAAKGVDLIIIGAVDESVGADGIIVKNNIQSVKDIKDKTVAFQEAMPSHFFLLWVLEKSGMKKDDILPVSMDADAAGSAFIAGKVDAAVTWEPWLSQAVSLGKGKILASTADYPGLLIDVIAVRRDVFDRRQREVIALYEGWMQAVELWKTDREDSERLMSQRIDIPLDEFKQNLNSLHLADQAFNERLFGHTGEGSITHLANQAIMMWKRARVMDAKSSFDPSKHLTDQVVKLANTK